MIQTDEFHDDSLSTCLKTDSSSDRLSKPAAWSEENRLLSVFPSRRNHEIFLHRIEGPGCCFNKLKFLSVLELPLNATEMKGMCEATNQLCFQLVYQEGKEGKEVNCYKFDQRFRSLLKDSKKEYLSRNSIALQEPVVLPEPYDQF